MAKDEILYICDRKRCKECMDSCKHTTDIRYAANYTKKGNVYTENDDIKNYQKGFRDGLLASGKMI